MKEFNRMAVILLVLILTIADLTLAVLKDFEESGIKNEKQFRVAVESPADAENWIVTDDKTSEADDNDDAAVTEADPDEVKEEVTRSEIIPLADVNDESLAQSMITVNGRLEGLVDKKVFEVSLPVDSTDIEYIADPQGLICRTGFAGYEDSWFDPAANVYFNRGRIADKTGESRESYTGTSVPFRVVNKSSCAVSVVARMFTSYPDGRGVRVPLTSDKDWESSKDPGIWLAAVRGDDMSETVLDRREKIITASVAGCPGAYCCRYDGPGTYHIELMTDEELAAFRADPKNSNVNTEFRDFSITLKGECSRNADWDPDADYIFPSVSVIWNVGLAESAKPAVTQKTVSVAGEDPVEIGYSFGILDGAADAITTAYYVTPEGEERDLRWNGYYLIFSDQSQTVTLTPEFLEYARERNGGVLRLRFNDPADTVAEITLDTDRTPGVSVSEYVITPGETRQITIEYDTGTGEKAASGIASMTFGKTDLLTSSCSSVKNGIITINASAVRMIGEKKGGKVVITFDDAARTRCTVKIKTDR
ncbi:hypothetical protein [Ruminococcus sp. HUN007]|uniref:hypothetical protein n=1 Tax=Ruminococcus sp. HUN007 TaxID=1514668 RepID=UPI0005D17035|nr:hypothetical protein [Ruminococcus sp. HUN007]